MGKLDKKKYIVVTGGVLSWLGKWVTAAWLWQLFSDQYKISPIKMDGYLNSDPGTMNPIEHWEVFVLEDGKEVDMDFGHYERFLGQDASWIQSITMWKIFEQIREKERNWDFLGKTVQFVPHVTNHIQDQVEKIAEDVDSDIVIVEVWGTVWDLENELYLEGLRQLRSRVWDENICYVHLTFVPIPYWTKEPKTKPTQQSVGLLQQKWIWPDFIIARCEQELDESSKEKIALFSNISSENVFSAPDLDSIYEIPHVFEKQNLHKKIASKISLPVPEPKKLRVWNDLLQENFKEEVTIAIAWKYTELEDSYASVVEALKHSWYHLGIKVNIDFIETSDEESFHKLKDIDGLIIPWWFGARWVEWKIKAINYVREHNIPFLGICYGLQLLVIEFLRNVCGISEASSYEFDNANPEAAITMLDEQKNISKYWGTMRLWSYKAELQEGYIKKLYQKFHLGWRENQKFIVSERHRHRYEVNPGVVDILKENQLRIVWRSLERNLVEFIEYNDHIYFVATQWHPELKSKLERPAPLFYWLVEASLQRKQQSRLINI